jgi:hypothetical protein
MVHVGTPSRSIQIAQLLSDLPPCLRPNRNQDAGIDVSPAVQQFLALNGIDAVDWRFVSSPLPGPWLSYGDLALNKKGK